MKRIKLITYIVLSQWTDGGDCLPLLPPLKGATTKQQQNNTDQLDERRPLGRTVTTLLNVTVRRVPF